ncbi:MAG TPA: leucine-rich repeat protein [Pirellulales bacterium]
MSTRSARKFVWHACLALPLVAVGCSRESQEKIRTDELIAKVEALGGTSSREPDQPTGPVRSIDLSEKKVDDQALTTLVQTHALGSLRTLDLSKTGVTGAGLAKLKGLKDLEMIDLGDSKINDPDLEPLTSLPNLKDLGLNSTQITNAGLEFLKAVPHLETLDLSNTAIDDAGLEPLKSLKHLTILKLSETKVTDAGVESLKKALPECNIER